MAKYVFKVILSDESINYYKPSELSNYELNDLDSFSLKYSLSDLENKIIDSLKTDLTVKKIFIVNERKEQYEFNLIGANNPYMNDIFNNLKLKQIYRKNHYEDAIIISNNCDNFIEMKNYLFNKLDELSDEFFNYVYNRNNNLSELLHRYLEIKKQVINSNEDANDLRRVLEEINNELSVYKTYRGLAISRFRYENQAVRRPLINKHKEDKKIEKNSGIIGSTNIDYNKDDEIDYYEKEEFFEDDEIESMAGEGNDVKGLRRLY